MIDRRLKLAIVGIVCVYALSGCGGGENAFAPTPTPAPAAPTHVPIVATAGTFTPNGGVHGVAFGFSLSSNVNAGRIIILYRKQTSGGTGGSAGGGITLSLPLTTVGGSQTPGTPSGGMTPYTVVQPLAQINGGDTILVTILAFDPVLPTKYYETETFLTAQ